MSASETIYTTCRGCGNGFTQPDDPGRKRVFCSNACKQRDYRARGGRASGTRSTSSKSRQRQAEEEAWAEQEAQRERARERMRRNRGRGQEQTETPAWTAPRAADSSEQAKKRRTCNLLFVRANHASTPPAEAETCRQRAEDLRKRYGL